MPMMTRAVVACSRGLFEPPSSKPQTSTLAVLSHLPNPSADRDRTVQQFVVTLKLLHAKKEMRQAAEDARDAEQSSTDGQDTRDVHPWREVTDEQGHNHIAYVVRRHQYACFSATQAKLFLQGGHLGVDV